MSAVPQLVEPHPHLHAVEYGKRRPYTRDGRLRWLDQNEVLSKPRRAAKTVKHFEKAEEAALASIEATQDALAAYERYAEEVASTTNLVQAHSDEVEGAHALVNAAAERVAAYGQLAAALGSGSVAGVREARDEVDARERELGALASLQRAMVRTDLARKWLDEAEQIVREAPSAKWHVDRGIGADEMFDIVRACDEGAGSLGILRTSCTCCGCVHEQDIKCSKHLYCTHARGTRQARTRAKDLASWKIHFDRMAPMMSMRAGKNRLGLKKIALTAPHEGAAAHRTEVMDIAYRHFMNKCLLPHVQEQVSLLAARLGVPDYYVPWTAYFEWEPGRDGHGHPHWNILILAPFISRRLLKKWWRRSLRYAGCARAGGGGEGGGDGASGDGERAGEDILCPFIGDARKRYDRKTRKPTGETISLEDAIEEQVKYMTKDCVSADGYDEVADDADDADDADADDETDDRPRKKRKRGGLVEPRIWETFCAQRDGRRSARRSKGFYDVLNDKPRCVKCGSEKARRKGEPCLDCGEKLRARRRPRPCEDCGERAYQDVDVEMIGIVEGHGERAREVLVKAHKMADAVFDAKQKASKRRVAEMKARADTPF